MSILALDDGTERKSHLLSGESLQSQNDSLIPALLVI